MRGYRPFTYVILAINGLFLIYLIGGVWTTVDVHVPDWCRMPEMAKAWPSDCITRAAVAASILVLWGLVDVILGVVWLMTNGRYKAKKAADATPAGDSAR